MNRSALANLSPASTSSQQVSLRALSEAMSFLEIRKRNLKSSLCSILYDTISNKADLISLEVSEVLLFSMFMIVTFSLLAVGFMQSAMAPEHRVTTAKHKKIISIFREVWYSS
jgi:hypothetical protein